VEFAELRKELGIKDEPIPETRENTEEISLNEEDPANEESNKLINKEEPTNEDPNKLINKEEPTNEDPNKLINKEEPINKEPNKPNDKEVINIETENEDDIDIFDDTDELITVTEKEIIPEHERIYKDDAVYIEDLENELLSELSINDQNNKFYQQKISEKVQKIIELKNEGQRLLDRDHNYPPVLDYYLNDQFTSHWLIPVILDKQKIYTSLDIELETSEEVNEDMNTDKASIKEVNLRDELEEYDKLLKDYQYQNISYDKFVKLSNKLVRPFITMEKLDNKDVGYKTQLTSDTNLLRYFNIDNAHWKDRIGTGPIYISSDVLDERKKVKATVRKILVNGEDINIVGFFLLPKNSLSLTDIVSRGITRFDKIGNISKIEPSTRTILTVNDHGLVTGDYIVIRGNEDLDSSFKVHVIDKDKLTINYDTSRLTIDQKGEVYGNMRLNYNTINIKKDTKGNFYLDSKVNPIESNLYLFDNISINEEDFQHILRLVVPTLNDIIVRQQIELEKAKFMEDVNIILLKYQTSYNDINIEQLNVIKKYLKKHILEAEVQVKESRIKYEKLIKERKPIKKDFANTLYADKYFFDKTIIELYGEYPLKDNMFDSLENRMNWIDKHNDYGNYYYNFVISMLDTYNKKEIQDTFRQITNTHDAATRTYEKEKMMDKYFDKCSKFVKQYKDVKELEDDSKTYEKGDYAIVLNPKGNPLIYKYKSDKWEYEEEAEDSESLLYLCGLEGEKVEILKGINCVYTLDGCKSKRLYKFEKIMDLTEEAKKDYDSLLKSINKMDDIVENKMKLAKIVLEKHVKESKKPRKEIEEAKGLAQSKIPVAIIQMLGKITKVKNPYARRHLMYQLLEKDGLSIGDVIYSKKYQGYLMCGHYMYMKREDYANDNSMKEIVREKLLSRFGDNGKSVHGQQSCKICGSYLAPVPYDDSPGFDDNGIPIILRDEWVDEDKTLMLALTKQSEKVLCKSKTYRTELINKGFDLDQIENGIKICEILQSITYKIGIQLLKTDFINVVADILEQWTLLPTYPVFRKKSVLLSRSKGLSQDKILKMDEIGIFKVSYTKFIILKKYALIVSRLLISIQTSVPPYQRNRPVTACTFGSWQGKYGVEYLACVLQEMKVLVFKDKDDKQRNISLEDTFDEIFKSLRTYNEKVTIKKLYGKRAVFDKSQPGRSEKKIDTSYTPKEVSPVVTNFEKKVLSNDDVQTLHNELYARMQYLSYSIKSLIKDATYQEMPVGPLTIQENSCCIDSIEGYKYSNFINRASEDKLKQLMQEALDINKYFNFFINNGSMTKIYLNPDSLIYTFNKAIHEVVTPDLIKKKFETYCYTGITKGELHYFIGTGDKEKCVKCEKLMVDIRETEFSKEDFEKLLDDIVERNYILPDERVFRTLVDIEKLKREDISEEVKRFVNKLAKITGKPDDNIFKEKYTSFLNALGEYNNVYDTESPNVEDSNFKLIKLIDNREENRIHLLKLYTNQYFRRYISIIANNYKIQDMTERIPFVTSQISQDLQKFIYDDYDQMAQYFTEQNAEIFKELKFDYSIRDISSIYGESDHYNCTWERVVKESKFNLKNATDVLMYILIDQLGKFLINENAITVANFILSMFDIIMSDKTIFDMSEKEIEKYRTTIYYHEYNKYRKEIAVEGSKADTHFLKMQGLATEDGTIDIDSLIQQDNQLQENNFKRGLQDEEITDFAKQRLGQDATDEQIEAFKETYKKNQHQEEYIYTNEFNMGQPMEDSEILEVGDDYGYMPQGTENEGAGISVYSQAEFREN